jgi:hypothetical protein
MKQTCRPSIMLIKVIHYFRPKQTSALIFYTFNNLFIFFYNLSIFIKIIINYNLLVYLFSVSFTNFEIEC